MTLTTGAIRDLDALMAAALARGPVTVVVACAHDAVALEAVRLASSRNLARAVLVGDVRKMQGMPAGAETLHVLDEEDAVRAAVSETRRRPRAILLKGKTRTEVLMRAALDRDRGLRIGRLLSDAFLFEHDGRLICVTDGGINVAPDLAAKRQIVENAVVLYHRLGIPVPRVAALSAVETVIPGHAASEDAAALARMAWDGCVVEGPLSLDLALSPEAAAAKGHGGEVAGRADILLCPDIVSANLLAKSTTWLGGRRLAHVVMGAMAPILIPSRSDDAEAKLHSIALGALAL